MPLFYTISEDKFLDVSCSGMFSICEGKSMVFSCPTSERERAERQKGGPQRKEGEGRKEGKRERRKEEFKAGETKTTSASQPDTHIPCMAGNRSITTKPSCSAFVVAAAAATILYCWPLLVLLLLLMLLLKLQMLQTHTGQKKEAVHHNVGLQEWC